MNKILYITDLDGTLLRNDATVSEYTKSIIKKVENKGIYFTYATARAYTSASAIMKDITPTIPAVVYNGTFIVSATTGNRIAVEHMTREESDYVLDVFAGHGISPIVYSIIDGVEKYSYCYEELPEASKIFLDARRGDARENPTTPDKLGLGQVFHFSSLGDGDKLAAIQRILKKDFPAELFLDRYFHEMFLEIHPKGATKAEGVQKLKDVLGCDSIVCFGDGTNDIPMFRIADECYAVANAEPALKEIATAVIGENESDGVAKWMEENLL
ncbi:MAG: HAD family phosphatase [Clostridia bacterium]|nr:HAD family phosphatase [Clostridia bacterium]